MSSELGDCMDNAHDKIEELRAEVERLTRENLALCMAVDVTNRTVEEFKAALMEADKRITDAVFQARSWEGKYNTERQLCERATAEVEKLRGLLRRAIKWMPTPSMAVLPSPAMIDGLIIIRRDIEEALK